MRTNDLDLPLAETPASRFLLWVTGVLVCLAVLAFAVASLADNTIRTFERQPRLVTVALPPPLDAASAKREMDEALKLIRTHDGVAYATAVTDAELDKLVEPWLGGDRGGTALLSMPRLIDVTFNPGAAPDLAGLGDKLDALLPGATIGAAETLEENRQQMAHGFRMAGLGIGLFLIVLSLVAVVMVTRMSLDLHDDTVDLLRLMGARDAYVARQFEHHALVNGMRGAIGGFVAAVAIILALLHGLPVLAGVPPLGIELRPIDWILLGIVPIVVALMLTGAARLTAVWGLARVSRRP